MKTSLSLLAAVVSTFVAATAFAEPPAKPAAPVAAAPKAPVGTGNFRRDEVVHAAGAKPQNVTVMGIATAGEHAAKANVPASIRISAVSVNSGPDKGKVTLVKAPVDKSERVEKLTAAEAHSYGLVTQADARKAASQNGGIAGSDKKVVVKNDGLAGNGYGFKQVAPGTLVVKEYGDQYKASNITRSVSFTGKGESASFGTEQIKAPTPAPAPAPAPAAPAAPQAK